MQMVQDLEGMGFTVVPFGQGYKDMSPPTKELMKLTLEERIAHGGHKFPLLMADNVYVDKTLPEISKWIKKNPQRKLMLQSQPSWHLDQKSVIRKDGSVYDARGILVF